MRFIEPLLLSIHARLRCMKKGEARLAVLRRKVVDNLVVRDESTDNVEVEPYNIGGWVDYVLPYWGSIANILLEHKTQTGIGFTYDGGSFSESHESGVKTRQDAGYRGLNNPWIKIHTFTIKVICRFYGNGPVYFKMFETTQPYTVYTMVNDVANLLDGFYPLPGVVLRLSSISREEAFDTESKDASVSMVLSFHGVIPVSRDLKDEAYMPDYQVYVQPLGMVDVPYTFPQETV